MRLLIVAAVLIATVSCAWQQPPAQVAAPPPPVALTAPPPPPVALAAPAPSPPLAPVATPAPYPWTPFAWLFAPFVAVPPAGRLTLSNYSFDSARVEAVIAGAPDCTVREGTTATDFVLPLNGTRIIQSVPGADVCWRRAIDPGVALGAPPSTPGWTEWNRVFLSTGRSVDSRL